jgi:hypothetical protein
MADFQTENLDIHEQIIRIDRMIAEIHRDYADHDRKRQEIKYAPWVLVLPVIVGSLTAGAALFAAGAAIHEIIRRCAMSRIALVILLLLLPPADARAQQRQFYDAAGRNAGRAVTDSQGTTTFYDATGTVAARSSPSGNAITTYDAAGHVILRTGESRNDKRR